MEQVGAEYQALLNDHVATKPMDVPFFSSVTGERITDSTQLGPLYWRRNFESPVLFHAATRAILEQPSHGDIFLEIGSHSALSGPLKQIFKATEVANRPVYVPSLIRKKCGTESLLTAVGQLYLLNVPIEFEAICSGNTILTSLPTYPWHHEAEF